MVNAQEGRSVLQRNLKQAKEMGLQESHEIQQREMQSPAAGEE